MIDEKKIQAYALKNAIEHDGKANDNAILNSLFHEGLEKSEIKTTMPLIKANVKKVNSMKPEEQKKLFKELEEETSKREVREEGELPELPNVHGKIVMRIAPFPSGAMHIGNARPFILNDEYVKRYKGELILVIDDTIGSEEKQPLLEVYPLIEEALKMLEVNYSSVRKKSDRLEIYYQYAEEMIKKGKAYVCSCSAQELRKNREEGKECSCRQFPVENQMIKWRKMFTARQGEFTLRIKTDMQHKNPAFRDRVIFRISDRAHPLTKNKYSVWPLLDFSWAIDDRLLGITHILRGKDLMIETEMEKYIFDIFGWEHPVFLHMGLLNFQGIKISKSKGQKEVKEGRYSGWDDPRTWSIQSLMKRGISPKAIRKFLVSLGIRQNEITVPIDVLYAENRKILHKISEKAKIEYAQKGNIEIIMEDGSRIIGNSDTEAQAGDIIHFIRFGYTEWILRKMERRFSILRINKKYTYLS